MICISIGNIDSIRETNELLPDMVELRIDLLKTDPEQVLEKLAPGIKILVTCRPGYFTEKERLNILRKAIERGVAYLDIEIESTEMIQALKESCLTSATDIIISYHNFEETPAKEELMRILQECYDKGANVAKLACMVKDSTDIDNLLSLYELPGRKVILGMGVAGVRTRLEALKNGAEFSFASLNEKEATAPGQITYKDMIRLSTKNQ